MAINKILNLFSITIIGILSLNACGSDIETTIAPVENQLSQIQAAPLSMENPAVTDEFVQNVSRLGVRLNEQQLMIISKQLHAKPSGKFASRPAMNLSSEQNLDIHFNKHKKEFRGIASKEQYLQSAISFLERRSPSANYFFDTTSFAKGYQSNVVKFDARTHEFSAMRADGDITTYYTNYRVSPKRFVMVPPNFVF